MPGFTLLITNASAAIRIEVLANSQMVEASIELRRKSLIRQDSSQVVAKPEVIHIGPRSVTISRLVERDMAIRDINCRITG